MTGSDGASVFTLGHSNHPIGGFLALLDAHAVEVVADVRSVPYSRRFPHFARAALERALGAAGIDYWFLGTALGGRGRDPDCLDAAGRPSYRRMATRDAFREAIARLREACMRQRIALVCAEREPLDCHRALLVARALVDAGLGVTHVHADGRLESHRDAVTRLIAIEGIAGEDLFRSRDEVEELAYASREARLAGAGSGAPPRPKNR